MKFSVNNKVVHSLNETQKKVLLHTLYEETFDLIIEDRVKDAIEEKYQWCLEKLKTEWLPKLKERGLKSIPFDDDELAELIFSQPDYEGRSKREPFRPGKDYPHDERVNLKPEIKGSEDSLNKILKK